MVLRIDWETEGRRIRNSKGFITQHPEDSQVWGLPNNNGNVRLRSQASSVSLLVSRFSRMFISSLTRLPRQLNGVTHIRYRIITENTWLKKMIKSIWIMLWMPSATLAWVRWWLVRQLPTSNRNYSHSNFLESLVQHLEAWGLEYRTEKLNDEDAGRLYNGISQDPVVGVTLASFKQPCEREDKRKLNQTIQWFEAWDSDSSSPMIQGISESYWAHNKTCLLRFNLCMSVSAAASWCS